MTLNTVMLLDYIRFKTTFDVNNLDVFIKIRFQGTYVIHGPQQILFVTQFPCYITY